MIAYHMQITRKVSQYGYDLEVNGQGLIFFKSVLRPITRTPFSCIDGI